MSPITANLSAKASLTQVQRTALTQVQRQSVELLQLQEPELLAAVEEALQSNPLLERQSDIGSDFEDDSDTKTANSASFQKKGQDSNQSTASETAQEQLEHAQSARAAFDDSAGVSADFERSKDPAVLSWKKTAGAIEEDDRDPFERVASARSLTDDLLEQVGCSQASPRMKVLSAWIIGNLTDEGLLDEPLDAVAANCPVSAQEEDWNEALALVQSLDPAGVGACNTTEVLLLQLKRMASQDNNGSDERLALAQSLLVQCQPQLLKHDFKSAAKVLGVNTEDVKTAFDLIATLDPHPVSEYADTSQNAFVVPEVLLVRENDHWCVKLNSAVVPHLRFDFENFELLTRAKLSREEKSKWTKEANEAKNFVHALEFRYSTIVAVAQKIADMQCDFFTRGKSALKPLLLRDVAQSLNLSESTVSRATTGKFMQTPLGTFELKFFFSTGFASADGDAVSSTAVRTRIRELVAKENPAKPLSDGAIADLLAQEGVPVARRTVAKYREMEHIAPKTLRKRM